MSRETMAPWMGLLAALLAVVAVFPSTSTAQSPSPVAPATGGNKLQEESHPWLTAELEPLRAQFNQDAGKVRLLLLLDPT